MQDTNWSQIEWELLSEEIELSPPWKADHFFNTFRLDMDGIYKIQIWRDEEYTLRAKLIGNCAITEQGDEEALECGAIVQSNLKGVWDYSHSAKLIQCFPEQAITHYLLQEDRTAVECAMGVFRIKVKPHKSLPKQKRESLVEWCLNAPTSTVLYVDSTERKVKTKLHKKRDMCGDSYIPNQQRQNSRDTVYIAFEKTGCYISQVPEQYEPRWSGKLSIEYRKRFGYVPDKKTREAVRELAGFLMGRDLKLIGRTEYSKSGSTLRAMAQNPQSVNIVKACRLCNQEIVPVHIYGDESLNFKETMEQFKNAVRNKVDQLNQMSVRDRNEAFFTQLGITYYLFCLASAASNSAMREAC